MPPPGRRPWTPTSAAAPCGPGGEKGEGGLFAQMIGRQCHATQVKNCGGRASVGAGVPPQNRPVSGEPPIRPPPSFTHHSELGTTQLLSESPPLPSPYCTPPLPSPSPRGGYLGVIQLPLLALKDGGKGGEKGGVIKGRRNCTPDSPAWLRRRPRRFLNSAPV